MVTTARALTSCPEVESVPLFVNVSKVPEILMTYTPPVLINDPLLVIIESYPLTLTTLSFVVIVPLFRSSTLVLNVALPVIVISLLTVKVSSVPEV